jgi:uncharacterized protein YfaS (alpha-2-macroglobulin family)
MTCEAIVFFTLGEAVRVSMLFTNAAGAAADPTSVRFKYKDPEGLITALVYPTDVALVKDSTGNYHVDVDANKVGVWHWKAYSTGQGQAADEGSFTVEESEFD